MRLSGWSLERFLLSAFGRLLPVYPGGLNRSMQHFILAAPAGGGGGFHGGGGGFHGGGGFPAHILGGLE
jgi:hypothetical protein